LLFFGVKLGICWKVPPLPIRKGAVVAEMRLIDSLGNTIQTAPLLAKEDVGKTYLFTLKDWWNHLLNL